MYRFRVDLIAVESDKCHASSNAANQNHAPTPARGQNITFVQRAHTPLFLSLSLSLKTITRILLFSLSLSLSHSRLVRSEFLFFLSERDFSYFFLAFSLGFLRAKSSFRFSFRAHESLLSSLSLSLFLALSPGTTLSLCLSILCLY